MGKRRPVGMGSAIGLAVVLLTVSACNPAHAPFRQVQFCFASQSDMSQLKSTLKRIAESEHLAYRDISETAYDQVKATGGLPKQNRNRANFINLYAGRDDGMGFGAGNLGLGDDQVAVGFTAGKDTEDARRLADRTVAELRKTWKVRDVPANSGALPLDCASHAQ